MFRVIELVFFVVEPIHADLFDCFEKIFQNVFKRLNINIPPRSAKTTLAIYFIVYTWLKNPKANFIYTSFSQELLGDISRKLALILENPVFKAMYPQVQTQTEESYEDPINDYWREYLYQATGKNVYTSRKIINFAGGVCLFSAMGAQITGFGAGLRKPGYTGALIIDDANKPSEMRHQKYRASIIQFYEETLLNRLNHADVPIINIQQRLHVQDLSAVLKDKYNFTTIVKPLLDENGVCQIPSQYTPERIKELQQNNYVFLAQFQQQPIIQGGQVIKRAYFRYYDAIKTYNYKRILIAADTAMKTKQHNDYSVFMAGGVTDNNELHVLDLLRGKWEAPELEKMAVMIWNKFKCNEKTGLCCNGLYIEDKSSGVGLVQGLKTKYGIPVFGVPVNTDKLTRVENVLPYLEAGQVYLSNNENYGFNPDLLAECESFSRDDSHLHDDQVDALCMLIQEAIAKTTVSILDYFM
nr:MAG TPA: Large Terminase [Caudoviricetes sp.]